MRSPTALAAAALVLFVLVGCTPAADTDTDTGSGDGTTASNSADAPTDDTSDAATDGSGPQPTLANAVDGAVVMAMSNDGIDPATLSVAVGDTVQFTSGDDGFHGLIINGLDSVTVYKNLPEYYTFTEAGKYAVSDDLSDATAVITVK